MPRGIVVAIAATPCSREAPIRKWVACRNRPIPGRSNTAINEIATRRFFENLIEPFETRDSEAGTEIRRNRVGDLQEN